MEVLVTKKKLELKKIPEQEILCSLVDVSLLWNWSDLWYFWRGISWLAVVPTFLSLCTGNWEHYHSFGAASQLMNVKSLQIKCAYFSLERSKVSTVKVRTNLGAGPSVGTEYKAPIALIT